MSEKRHSVKLEEKNAEAPPHWGQRLGCLDAPERREELGTRLRMPRRECLGVQVFTALAPLAEFEDPNPDPARRPIVGRRFVAGPCARSAHRSGRL